MILRFNLQFYILLFQIVILFFDDRTRLDEIYVSLKIIEVEKVCIEKNYYVNSDIEINVRYKVRGAFKDGLLSYL